MNLEQIKEEIIHQLATGLPSDRQALLKSALKGIEGVLGAPQDATTGEKAQKLADQLLPLLLTTVPVSGALASVIALFEPYLGDAIDWLGQELAPIKVTDKQGGAVVHDDGDAAPIV